MREIFEKAQNEYFEFLNECDKEIMKWKAEGDMYGVNFHQGMRSGANQVNIYYDRIRRKLDEKRPTVVCLCGSTRFMDAFQKAKFDETFAGRIVLSIGCDTKSDGELFKGPEGDAIKIRLDELHKRKIDLADEVLILNVGGYVGSSTKSELEYAQKHGKRVRWLEPK